MDTQPRSTHITISDILRLALPLSTAVVADNRQTRQPINWVSVLTSWDELAVQTHAQDFVLIPPALQESTSEPLLHKYLAHLADLGVSGVLCFRPLSDMFRNRLAEIELPALVAPETITVREANRAIASLLVDRQSATSERGLQLYRTLSEMSREELGLQAMTDVICKLTGKIIIVQDKRLELRTMSIPAHNDLDVNRILEELTQREHLPAILRNRKAAAKARQSYWQQVLPIENIGRLISPIVSGDRARGYLSVVGLADDLDMLDSQAVEHGAAAFALEMAKAKAVSEAKKALRGDFLEGLLAGTLPRKEIERLEGRLDHDTSIPHAAMIFAWAGRQTPTLRRLETAIHWVLRNHSRPALVHVYGDRHVCVFQALKNELDMDSAHDLGRRIHEEVRNEFPEARFIAGMSGPAKLLSEWPTIYDEALQAMQLADRLRLNHVVEFNGLGVYQLLVQLEDIPAVQQFMRQVIGPLVDYDQQHNSTLVETIDAYFGHHGNISQTAESLYIHRNTLLYRLDRIQDLTGHDLNQANMRLALHLALKLWQLRPS